MKKLFAVLTLGLLGSGAFAQTLEKGDNVLYFGFGLDPYYRYESNLGKHNNVGPIVAGYEYILTDKLGVGRIALGGLVGHTFYNRKWTAGPNDLLDKNSRTALLFKAAYHFDLPVKGLDLYAGIGGGLYFHNDVHRVKGPNGDVVTDNRASSVGGGHYVFGGVRYFFGDTFGLYLEGGHGFSALQFGFAFKF